jgi:hypothetical protein
VEAQQRGLPIAASGPCCRAGRREVDLVMMPFFLTMPISRMMPISAIRLKSIRRHQDRERTDTG